MNIADLEYRVRNRLPLTAEQQRYLQRHREAARDREDNVDFVTPIITAIAASSWDSGSSSSSSYDSGSSSDSGSSFGGGDSGGGGASSDW